jgi:carbonic anhydrase
VVERRTDLISSQHPIAIVVGCSDSRVPPEAVFDQGLGDIFVVRTAGQVLDNASMGSIEYAVEHLGVPLLVVLGHDSCGAVTAAVKGGEAPGHMNRQVESILPAVDEAKEMNDKGELLNNSIDNNINNIRNDLIDAEPILSEKVRKGELSIVGARYHLDTGAVQIFE